jgi:hypothetical protein
MSNNLKKMQSVKIGIDFKGNAANKVGRKEKYLQL